ncbi:hypothetical protein KKG22_03160 [Patescibacteria group bacterium]|nr:hypothetical protein [Patescibacteria group bacterium]MBU1721431.1 hypothetical protein [Patescibacteria group bacterium]MBU1901576.1 hypothetical protein [Patescibacteria group bacterium]
MTEQPVKNTTTKEDIEKNKGMAALAYIIFFLPMLTEAKDSPYAMFHANQGLVLLILAVLISMFGSLPLIGWFVIMPLGSLLVIVLWFIGIINAINGKMTELPLIGSFHLIDQK